MEDIYVDNTTERVGFETVVSRNAANRGKSVDTGIVAAMVRDAYTRVDKAKDTISLRSGEAITSRRSSF